jgi:hypothetical protein
MPGENVSAHPCGRKRERAHTVKATLDQGTDKVGAVARDHRSGLIGRGKCRHGEKNRVSDDRSTGVEGRTNLPKPQAD